MRQKGQRKAIVAVAACLLVLLIGIWVFPFSMNTAYMQLVAPTLPQGTTAEFTVHSSQAYEPQYVIAASVQDGSFLVKLDHEYLAVERVEISDASVAQAITALHLRGNAVGLADYTAASLTSDVIASDENGAAMLSAAAIDTVHEGIESPWMMRVLLTVLLVGVVAAFLVCRLLRRRFGTIPMLTVVAVSVGCAMMLFSAKTQGLLNKGIPFIHWLIPNWLPIVMLTGVMAVVLIVCFLAKGNTTFSRVVIVTVYVVVLALSIGKMALYTERVGNTPDEPAHIGYVAHLTQTGELVPKYDQIRQASVLSTTDDTLTMKFADGSMTYLKHPPTYYHILRLANAVEFQEDGTFVVQIERLRLMSMAFVVAAMLLMFYIGLTRLKGEPLVHLLYASVATMVPMLCYTAAGINNDSMTLLTMTIFFLGILRYLEKKRGAATYLLIAVGISLSVLTKVTAGIVVALAAVIVLVGTLIKEKSWKQLLKPAFLISLPLYLLPVAYFGYVFLKYGGIQPNMFSLNPEYARSTGFYVDVVERSSRSFVQYIQYFFSRFMKTWTGISSHIALEKTDHLWLSLQNAALVAVWFVPALYAKRSLRNKSPYSLGVIAGCVGVLTAVVMQLFNGFDVFVGRGYLGGFQSRYYLCAIVFFAFGAALAVEKVLEALDRNDHHVQCLRQTVKAATVFYIGLLLYEDILYFLMHYNGYLL